LSSLSGWPEQAGADFLILGLSSPHRQGPQFTDACETKSKSEATPARTYRPKIDHIDQLGSCVSAAFIAAVVCFDVLEFDPKTTTAPITTAIAPIIVTESNLIAPSK
jgi:hypothetical protein